MTGNLQRYKRTPSMAGVWLALTLVLLGVTALEPEQRIIALPIFALVAIATTLITALWKRDGSLPVFDLGVVCVTVTAIYLCYPLLMFLGSGLAWTELSDNRIQVYNPTPSEFAKLGWWGVLYLSSLALTYATIRRCSAANCGVKLESPSNSTIVAIVMLLVCLLAYVQVIQVTFGVDLNPTYGAEGTTVGELPLLVEQITGKLIGITVVLQFGLVLLLVSRANVPVWRWTLAAWAGFEIIKVLAILGGRSFVVFFLVAWLLAHHRLRRPLRPAALLATGIAIFSGSLVYGMLRQGWLTEPSDIRLLLSGGNEFQSVFATAYDLMARRDSGQLPSIPWQLYFADVLRVIPQQLLPFEKIDQSEWYLDLIGVRGTGVGFMFSVVSEAVIGFGAVEMVLRGLVLGFILGAIHNWYSRRAFKFWPTLFYLWLCVLSYYTYRASTFNLLAYILYVFVPTYIFVKILSGIIELSKQRPLHV